MNNRRKNNNSGQNSRKWYAMDLHLHTPGSSDYQQPETTYLQILQRAEARGLDMIAFADHNTVVGYRKMMEEIEQLRLLAKLNRILPEEDSRLREYDRLSDKITILPGFEFTATFGFHILGIFPKEKPIREIEHLLLALNVPSDQLDEGSATIGASSDVIAAYAAINGAGGMAIAAHANSTNGIAMRGFNFGGQTKIAYTQDMNLRALEVTDLEHRGRRTTANFFNGTKPEYPRRMHAIQGSDAHRLETDPRRNKNLGIGDRATEVSLTEPTFAALQELFLSNDFARTRPRRKRKDEPEFDFISAAREEGANIIQDFHEGMTVRGGKLYAVISDVGAFANTNGGTLYIGMSSDSKAQVKGISDPRNAIKNLEKEISNRISPPLEVTIDEQKTAGKSILRVLVPRGEDPPYAVEDSKIYVREEGETGLAVRDEIVNLVKRNLSAPQGQGLSTVLHEAVSLVPEQAPVQPKPTTSSTRRQSASNGKGTPSTATPNVHKSKSSTAPRTGVEVIEVTKRQGTEYYSVRDLRNGNVVKNVTTKSARKLWGYAIAEFAKLPRDLSKAKITWQGNFGLLTKYKKGEYERFDLAQKVGKNIRVYFGVTEDGIGDNEDWRKIVGLKED